MRLAGREWARGRPGFRDHLDWTAAAGTLLLTGSRLVSEMEGDQVRALAEDCPAHIARDRDTHCCAEIEVGRESRPGSRSLLHVEACNRHW